MAWRQCSVSALGDKVEHFEYDPSDQDLAPGRSDDGLRPCGEVSNLDRNLSSRGVLRGAHPRRRRFSCPRTGARALSRSPRGLQDLPPRCRRLLRPSSVGRPPRPGLRGVRTRGRRCSPASRWLESLLSSRLSDSVPVLRGVLLSAGYPIRRSRGRLPRNSVWPARASGRTAPTATGTRHERERR